MTTIDASPEALRLDRLDFIKADIEGWELALLRGGEKTLRRFRPVLVIELLGQQLARAGDSIDDAFALLSELGYTAFALTPDNEMVPAVLPATANTGAFRANTEPPGSAKLALATRTRAGGCHD